MLLPRQPALRLQPPCLGRPRHWAGTAGPRPNYATHSYKGLAFPAVGECPAHPLAAVEHFKGIHMLANLTGLGVPEPHLVADAQLIGAWGLGITWSDGHSTGIYPFSSLHDWIRAGHPVFTPDSGLGD